MSRFVWLTYQKKNHLHFKPAPIRILSQKHTNNNTIYCHSDEATFDESLRKFRLQYIILVNFAETVGQLSIRDILQRTRDNNNTINFMVANLFGSLDFLS